MLGAAAVDLVPQLKLYRFLAVDGEIAEAGYAFDANVNLRVAWNHDRTNREQMGTDRCNH